MSRTAVSAVSSEADTTQSSCWRPLPKVVEEVMPAMAHTWMVEGSEAGVSGGGPRSAERLDSGALRASVRKREGASRRRWPALLLSGPRSITMRAHDRDDAPQPTAAARRRLVLPAVCGLLVLAAPAQGWGWG
jgi:hypothetical protein